MLKRCRVRFDPPKFAPPTGSQTDSVETVIKGMPSATTLTLSTAKSVTGTTPFNPDDHFLLADLDPAKDAALFGYDREEFFENVAKMKKVILHFHRWERTDGFYKYATWAVKFLCAFLVMDIFRNTHAKLTFRDSHDNFMEASNEDVEELVARRKESFEQLKLEFRAHPPCFAAVSKAEADSKNAKVPESHPLDTLKREEKRREEEAARVREALELMGADPMAVGAASYSTSPTAIPALRAARRILLPQVEDYTSVVKEEIYEHQRRKSEAKQHPEKEMAEGKRYPGSPASAATTAG